MLMGHMATHGVTTSSHTQPAPRGDSFTCKFWSADTEQGKTGVERSNSRQAGARGASTAEAVPGRRWLATQRSRTQPQHHGSTTCPSGRRPNPPIGSSPARRAAAPRPRAAVPPRPAGSWQGPLVPALTAAAAAQQAPPPRTGPAEGCQLASAPRADGVLAAMEGVSRGSSETSPGRSSCLPVPAAAASGSGRRRHRARGSRPPPASCCEKGRAQPARAARRAGRAPAAGRTTCAAARQRGAAGAEHPRAARGSGALLMGFNDQKAGAEPCQRLIQPNAAAC